jgi:hypothetical protein
MGSKKKKPRKETRPANAPDIPTAERLRYATEVLQSIRHAREDYVGQRDRLRRLSAVRNFMSNGASFTWTLQNVRHREPDFEQWWASWRQELENDEAARFFYTARASAIHEGQVDLKSSTYVYNLSQTVLHRAVSALVPNGPYRVVLGDSAEGSTNYVVGSDGNKVYFDPPGTISWESVGNIPDQLAQVPLPILMDRYIALLERILVSANIHFSHVL